MAALMTTDLKINHCPCESCERMLVKLGTFQEVKEIKRDAKESHRLIVSITGDPYRVTREIVKHSKIFEHRKQSLPMNNQQVMPIVLPQIHDQHMVVSKSCVLKINDCTCSKFNDVLAKVKNISGVQWIDRVSEPNKVSILINGDQDRVTKELKKHNEKFQFEKIEHFEQSLTKNKREVQIVSPQLAPVQGIHEQHMAAQQPVDKSIVKKTQGCPKCKHELELKSYDHRFTCDGCMEDGFGSRYRCERCDYDLHEECMSPEPTISPEFFQGSTFEFRRQPSSTRARKSCYACAKDIRGHFYHSKSEDLDLHFYHSKSEDLDLHPCCGKLKIKLCGMDFVHRGQPVSSSSKCVLCTKKTFWGTTKSRNPGGCSYVCSSNKCRVHVHCITQMVPKDLKSVSTDSSIDDLRTALGKIELPLTNTNTGSNKSNGGGVIEILKTLSTFLGAIVGLLFGDLTGMLVPLILELLISLPKLLRK